MIVLGFVVVSFRYSSHLDPLNTMDDDDESHHARNGDLSTSDYHSFVAPTETSLLTDSSPMDFIHPKKKMFDVTELLGGSATSFDDKQEICHWFEKLQPISTSSPSSAVVDYLRAQTINHDQDIQWQIEQNRLKYGTETVFPSNNFLSSYCSI